MQTFPGYDTDAISVGPWGGQSGAVWNDGLYSGIRQLIIIHGAGIDSIQVEYDVNGTSMWCAKHGGHGGSKTDKVKFDYPEEYLTSIHGHYGSLSDWSPVFVRSLTFGTNKKTYGPFGIEYGTYFSLPTNGIKIVGLHGRSAWYLEAIGAHLRPLKQKTQYTTQGNPQTEVVTRATQSGYSIIQGSLGNQYDVVLALKPKEHAPMQQEFSPRIPAHAQPLPKMNPQLSIQNSSSSRSAESSDAETPQAWLRAPTKVDGPVTYGPWGGGGGSAFEDGMYKGIKHIKVSRNVGLVSIRVLYVDPNGHEVWGDRHGGTGGFIRGKKLQPALTDADNKLVLAKQGAAAEAAHCGVVKEAVPCEAGPWGGDGGRPWDDGVYSGIRQIYLTRDDAINSIQIEYDRNGQSVWSVKHGGNGGRTTHPIKLEYPNEVVTCISGYYASPLSKDGNSKVIRSLTFYTNRGKYGPYGEEVGTFFTSAKTDGKMVGFHGRSGSYLDAIGVHMQHWLGNQKLQSKPIFKLFSS